MSYLSGGFSCLAWIITEEEETGIIYGICSDQVAERILSNESDTHKDGRKNKKAAITGAFVVRWQMLWEDYVFFLTQSG